MYYLKRDFSELAHAFQITLRNYVSNLFFLFKLNEKLYKIKFKLHLILLFPQGTVSSGQDFTAQSGRDGNRRGRHGHIFLESSWASGDGHSRFDFAFLHSH